MTKLNVREGHGAVTFEVRVSTRSRQDRILGVADGVLRVALTAAPVDGAANEALRELLADELGVSKSDVEIVRGSRTRIKLIRVSGLEESQVDFDQR